MVTRRISAALLTLAASRWPAALRDDLRREWTAELHVLSEGGRSWAMLRYAVSLAVSRPVPDHSAMPLGRRAWHAVRLVLLAPLLCAALYLASLIAMNVVLMPLQSANSPTVFEIGYAAQVPLATAFTLLAALLMYHLGRRWSRPLTGRPAIATLTVVAPGVAFPILAHLLLNSTTKAARHAPVYACYFALLTVALVAAAHLVRRGRIRRGRWTASLGALGAADVAVTLPFLTSATRENELSLVTAPLWLFSSLTDWGFGVIEGMGVFLLGDILELDAQLLIVFTGWAFGVVFAAARATVAVPAPEAAIAGES
ncbi:MAG: hypothetical protein HOV79_01695 [Hamadaea sp.]|nr:hypothetical protein [Hamadaea sp.]